MTSTVKALNYVRATGIGAPKLARGKRTLFEEDLEKDSINEDGFANPGFCHDCADDGIRTVIHPYDYLCAKCGGKDEEEEDERVDDDGSFIPRGEWEYIGVLPSDLTRKKLIKVMAKALIMAQNDEFNCTGKRTSFDEDYWFEGLDLWFEHDRDGNVEGKTAFCHLVPEDDMETFNEEVRKKIVKYV